MFQEFTYDSINGTDKICAWAYHPYEKPKAVIQFLHGICDHSRRYLYTIYQLLDQGYAVYSADALNFGKTGLENGNAGFAQTKDGYWDYIEDEKTLHDIAREKYPDIPYILMGHSWGSMRIRAYITKYGEDISAVILSGTVAKMFGMERLKEDPGPFADYVARSKNEPLNEEWTNRLWEKVFARVPEVKYGNDYAAVDEGSCTDYLNDPFIVQTTSAQFMYDVFVENYGYITDESWAEKVPKHIKVFNTFGDEDPTTGFAVGAYWVSNVLAESGHRVVTRPCAGFRHDLLTDRGIRDTLIADIIAFANRVVSENDFHC